MRATIHLLQDKCAFSYTHNDHYTVFQVQEDYEYQNADVELFFHDVRTLDCMISELTMLRDTMKGK